MIHNTNGIHAGAPQFTIANPTNYMTEPNALNVGARPVTGGSYPVPGSNTYPWMPTHPQNSLTAVVAKLVAVVDKLIGMIQGNGEQPPPVSIDHGFNMPQFGGQIESVPGRPIQAVSDDSGSIAATPGTAIDSRTTEKATESWGDRIGGYIDKAKAIWDKGQEAWSVFRDYGKDIWNGVSSAGRWITGLFT